MAFPVPTVSPEVAARGEIAQRGRSPDLYLAQPFLIATAQMCADLTLAQRPHWQRPHASRIGDSRKNRIRRGVRSCCKRRHAPDTVPGTPLRDPAFMDERAQPASRLKRLCNTYRRIDTLPEMGLSLA
jgi:hypothetical protein